MKFNHNWLQSYYKSDLKKIGAFFILVFFVFQVNAQSTLDSLKTELSISRSNKVSVLLAIAQYFHGTHLDSSLFYTEKAWQIAKGNEEEIQLVNVYSEFGRIKILMSSYEEALEYFLKAEEHGKQISPLPKNELIRINSNLGVIYERQGETKKAIEYLEKGLALLDEVEKDSPSLQHSILYAALYNNMANAYIRQTDTTKAIVYQRKGLVKALEADDYKQASSLYNNIGKTLLEQNEIAEAYPYLIKGLRLREQHNDELGMVWSYRNMAFYFLKANELDSAKYFIKMSLASNQKIGSLLDAHDQAYQLLTSIYEKEGKYDSALASHKLYILYKDSIYSGPKFKEQARIEAKYEMLKKTQAELADRRSREFRNIIITAGLVFGLITISLLYGLQRFRSKNQKLKYEQLQLREEKLLTERKTLNLELDYKRKDLTTHVLYLLKKDELIHKIVQKLNSFKKELASENQQKIFKITRDLKTILGRTDNSWQEFELRFKEVHSDFYDKLEAKFPELTPKERRLCALLKLNMTTKEISSVTHQSARSIDVARTRLRRKFNLTNSEVGLVDFLSKF